MVRVLLPSQLQSYARGASRVEVRGDTVAAALEDLDRMFPVIRFRVIDEQDRIRPHMRIFVGRDRQLEIATALREADEVLIFGALSGG